MKGRHSSSVLVARQVGDNIPIGAKIMLRRFTGSGATRKTMEILVGQLERNGSGDLGLAVCSDNRELPASVIVQRPNSAAGLGESRLEPASSGMPVEYAPSPDDEGEIIGVVVMAITPE